MNYTHLLYDVSAMIYKLRMKDAMLVSGVKLNSATLSFMNVIDMHPGMSVSEIAKTMNLTKGAVSQMLNKCCTLGMAEKHKSECNEKNVYPVLTDEGHSAVLKYHEVHDRFYDSFSGTLNQFSPEEQQVIYRFLSLIDTEVREYMNGLTTD